MTKLRGYLFASRSVVFAIAAGVALLAAGCGGGEDEPGLECDGHADCEEACFGGKCVDAPQMGDECPAEYDGKAYDGLQCIDGLWQIDGLGLAIYEEPPSQVVAGESFQVAVKIADEDGERYDMAGVEIILTVEGGEFAGGESQMSALTADWGVASFAVVIEVASEGYRLEATIDEEGFDEVSAMTESFDVHAAAPDGGTSSIYGEADYAETGEEVALFIELFDEFENPVAGVVPEFEASGEGNEYGACSETDDSGVATCSMTATEIGVQSLRITAPVETTGQSIDFQLPCSEADSPFGGGEGTPESPHRLCAPHHISAIGLNVAHLEGNYVMARDIDLEGVQNFNPIGDSSDPFVGTFDGAGRTISRLKIDAEDADEVGLFGRIGNDGTVHSLILEDVDITGNIAVGALAGYGRGTFSDIHVSGEVNGFSYAGGFVGYLISARSERISAQVTVTSEDDFAGGLIGFMFAEVSDSWAGGDVSGGDSVGGLAGMLMGELRSSYSSGNVSGQDKVGGLIGETSANVTIIPEIEQSYASGEVQGDNRVGGLIGFHPVGPVEDCYVVGGVSGSGSAVGGIIGWNGDFNTGSEVVGEIVNCYVAGEVDGGGVLFGYLSDYGVGDVHDVYWDSETTGSGSGGIGTELTTAEFGDDSNFNNWNFDDIWQIGVAPDGHERPVFQWQVE